MLARLPSIPAFEIKLEIRGERKCGENEEGVFKLFFNFRIQEEGENSRFSPDERIRWNGNEFDGFFPRLENSGKSITYFSAPHGSNAAGGEIRKIK